MSLKNENNKYLLVYFTFDQNINVFYISIRIFSDRLPKLLESYEAADGACHYIAV